MKEKWQRHSLTSCRSSKSTFPKRTWRRQKGTFIRPLGVSSLLDYEGRNEYSVLEYQAAAVSYIEYAGQKATAWPGKSNNVKTFFF
ncbi:MAG: hypothetical protein JW925_13800 [Syntrophaceae bacterium]|nr:hypothetical protein [Syntrophaceae bacterium]